MCNNDSEKMGTRIREIPEDIEWPRYEDGALVDVGDLLRQGMVVGIEMRTEGYHIECLRGSVEGPYGACVIRPALAADGEIVEAGDTVWNAATGEEYWVVDVCGGYVYLGKNGSYHVDLKLLADALTHKRPVLDADGAPIYEGDALYEVKTGRPCKVHDVMPNELGGRALVEFDAPELEEKERAIFAPGRLLTHKPPIRDADGVPIHEGDTVYLLPGGYCGDYPLYYYSGGDEMVVKELDPAHELEGVLRCAGDGKCDCFPLPHQLTHTKPEPPDTWERIEEDAEKSICEYFDRIGKGCDGCPGGGSTKCAKAWKRDIVRRCKRLAERGA